MFCHLGEQNRLIFDGNCNQLRSLSFDRFEFGFWLGRIIFVWANLKPKVGTKKNHSLNQSGTKIQDKKHFISCLVFVKIASTTGDDRAIDVV